MANEHDVIVIGAGVAGLAAAKDVAAAGLNVLVVEARDRIGGRIHTLHDPDWVVPIELGAEFVHGREPEFWKLLERYDLVSYQCADEHWNYDSGRLRKMKNFWETLDRVLGKLPQDSRHDLSFAQFVRNQRRRLPGPKVIDLALAYVEGFNAADAHKISVSALAQAQKEEERIDRQRIFRLLPGYEGLVRCLFDGLAADAVTVRLRTLVRKIRWSKQQVQLEVSSAGATSLRTLHARRVIVTLPLGVLQAQPGAPGAVEFEPPLPRKIDAAHQLEMGAVVKIALRFSRAFWETDALRTVAKKQRLTDMSFMHSPSAAFPTWWNYLPLRSRILIGWAGGPAGHVLSHRLPDHVLGEAMTSLSTLLGLSRRRLTTMLEAHVVADWQADPFARGAYSYIPVGASGAMEELAKSIDDTLFFAGEATQYQGSSATVPGALASGRRAAREVLNASRRRR